MTLTDAEAMARELFVEHNLNFAGWTFKFDNAKVRFGLCNHGTRTISMSKHLVEANTAERVKLTMLHEIAHALVGSEHGHDSAWRKMCLYIGGDGQRAYTTANTVTIERTPRRKPQLKKGVCGRCSHVWFRRRLPARGGYCPMCSNRRLGRYEMIIWTNVRG